MLNRGNRQQVYGESNETIDFIMKESRISPDKEIVDTLGQLGTDTWRKCLSCTRSQVLDVISQYNQDVGCSGCVRTLKTCLSEPLPDHGLIFALFEESNSDTIRLRDEITTNSDPSDIAKLFMAFNNPGYFTKRPNGKRHRCGLHTAHPRVEEEWFQIWDEMPDSIKSGVASMEVTDLTAALTSHLKNLYFCRDCRGNVLKALDLLVGYADPDDLSSEEEFCEDYFDAFALHTEEDEDDFSEDMHSCEHRPDSKRTKDISSDDLYGPLTSEPSALNDVDNGFDSNIEEYVVGESSSNRHQHQHHGGHRFESDSDSDSYCSTHSGLYRNASHVFCDLDHIPRLVVNSLEADARDEAARANGQGSDRHAPTLKDGQTELLHCIGNYILARIKETWISHLVRVKTVELASWMILSSMRTNLQSEVQTDFGNEALIALLEDNQTKKKDLIAKKNKKKKKKNKEASVILQAKLPPVELPDMSINGWSFDAEARFLAQLSRQSAEGEADVVEETVKSVAEEEGALTEDEIREAQLSLKKMMNKSSRAELRANLKEKFDNLCLKST